MNVQKFIGKDMRTALSSVRDQLGPDAVIIDTTETATGLEITAALDFDPAAFAAARKPQAGELRIESVPYLDDVREEVQSIRCLIESHLARSGWSDAALGTPVTATLMRNLSSLGLAPDIVRRIVGSIAEPEKLESSWAAPLRLVSEAIPFAAIEPVANGGAIAIVGPTGSGKTSTIGKLAARYVLQHSPDDLALVSLDNLRIGASEQIEVLGRLIGVPVYRANSERDLKDILPLLDDRKLVLIDTPGIGATDARLPDQIRRLQAGGFDVRTLLALPANLDHVALQETVRAYEPAGLSGTIITKIDESTSLGPVLSVVIRSGIDLAYLTDGQNIPEDLHVASERKSWLSKQALETMRSRGLRASDRYMADNFFAVAGDGVAA